MVIIHKPNKSLYDSPKSFRPIVLLNTLRKLIEKIIGERIQFHAIANDFIHPSQLGGLKFKSTIDAEVNVCFTDVAFFPSPYTAFSYSFIITPLYLIHSRPSEKCKEGWPFGY